MNNYQNVFKIFKKNYKLVPLEVFGNDPYKTLVSTLLSARTNDDTTLARCLVLFDKAPDIKSLNNLDIKILRDTIYPIGFYKTKAKHLKSLANILVTKFNSQVPKTREELMILPGVGRKTANLVLNRAFGIPAIAVDTHLHRITNMLKWVKTKTPQQTEMQLIKIVPQKYWSEMNKFFVSIGRQYRSERQLKEFLKKNKLMIE